MGGWKVLGGEMRRTRIRVEQGGRGAGREFTLTVRL
jgi:hypothetical protein